MKKALCNVIMVMFIVSMMAGCGQKDPSSDQASNSSPASVSSADNSSGDTQKKPVKLKMLGIVDHQVYLDKLSEAYHAKNGNVTVEFEYVPYAQLFEVIEVKLSSKATDCDVISVDCTMVAPYGSRDYLLPLNKYFTDEEKNMLIPNAISAGTYKGNLLAPLAMNSSQVLWYNKDLLSKAGVELPGGTPNDRMTWEKVAENCRTIMEKLNPKRDNGIWGLLFEQISRPYQFLPLPNSLGGKGIGDDGVTVDGVINDNAWVAAATYYRDLFNTWNVSPKGVGVSETMNLFCSGKVAYFIGGTWDIYSIKGAKDLNYGYAYHPYFEKGKPASPDGNYSYGVNKYSKNPDAAVEFVKFMLLDKDSQMTLYKNFPSLLVHKEALETLKTDPALQQFPDSSFLIGIDESMNTAVSRPVMAGYQEWENVLTNTLEDIRNGQEAKEALDKAVDTLKPMMEKYK